MNYQAIKSNINALDKLIVKSDRVIRCGEKEKCSYLVSINTVGTVVSTDKNQDGEYITVVWDNGEIWHYLVSNLDKYQISRFVGQTYE